MSKFNLFYLFLFVSLFVLSTQSKAQTYMDLITEKSCSCLNNISDSIKTEELHLKLGVCMLETAEPYKKQLKADYDIDLDRNDDSGEKLGRIIGLKMATKCPTALMKMANRAEENEAQDKSASGVVTKIENDHFVILSIKDEQGKISKYYWLTFIQSNTELSTKYKSLIGKKVNVTYTSQDFFDPKLDEYRPIAILISLDIAN
ncbi:MAG TPA: hypothetical protein PKC41_05640 [Chitinophagaceae bacterium]|nr:hypothetical protein [Chitinophagaceae bacterium]